MKLNSIQAAPFFTLVSSRITAEIPVRSNAHVQTQNSFLQKVPSNLAPVMVSEKNTNLADSFSESKWVS